jgi:hypothetical protein
MEAILAQIIPGLKCFSELPRGIPFPGAETALIVGGRRMVLFLDLRPVGQNRRDFWWRRSRATFRRDFTGLRRPLEDSRERKPARRRTHDDERFFVEMVPKRYTFGTGTLPKCLDLAWLERTPKRGVLGQNLNASSHQ